MMTLKEVFDDLGIEIGTRMRFAGWGRPGIPYPAYNFSARTDEHKLLNTLPEKREVYEYMRAGPCALFLIKLTGGGIAGFTYNALSFGGYQMQRFWGLSQYQERVKNLAKHVGKEASYRDGSKIDVILFTATLGNESIKGFRWN